MTELEYEMTPQDYARAQYLHMRPRRWLVAVGAILALLYLVTFGMNAASVIRNGGPYSLLLLFALPILLLAVHFGWLLPWRARRLWKQQKALHSPIRMRIGDDGLDVQTEHGHARTPWDHLHRWKENNHLFLLYDSDNLFQMIPKRVLRPDQILGFRELLLGKMKAA